MEDLEVHPNSFFTVILPSLLATKGDAAHFVDAVVQFYLIGEPSELWYADLTDPAAPVVAGEHDCPDLSVSLTPDCLAPVLRGDLDIEAAIAEGRLAVHGDLSVLDRLARLFLAGSSWLEIVTASTGAND
jgi:putative sterol carrier protein